MPKKLIYIDIDSFERFIFECKTRKPYKTIDNTYQPQKKTDMLKDIKISHNVLDTIRAKKYCGTMSWNKIQAFIVENNIKNTVKQAKDHK